MDDAPSGTKRRASGATVAESREDELDACVLFVLAYTRTYEEYWMREEREEKEAEERRKRRRELLARYASLEQIFPDKKEPVLSIPAPAAIASPEDKANVTASGHLRKAPAPSSEHAEPSSSDDFVEIEVNDEADIDDMFSLQDTPAKKKIRLLKSSLAQDAVAQGVNKVAMEHAARTSAVGLHDNWDDPDGYYRTILGEQLGNGRYQVFAILGRGIFSSVVRAKDLHENAREVAIKIVRRQETMYKAGLKEIQTLRTLAVRDPDDKKYIVRLYGQFEHRGHLCIVFESLGLNLREIVKRFGKDVGLNLQAVKTYAKQMFLALAHLKRENIIHADIKPDNILVNESKTFAKLCDLGSATNTNEMEITPYLVSRFYRAPEISA